MKFEYYIGLIFCVLITALNVQAEYLPQLGQQVVKQKTDKNYSYTVRDVIESTQPNKDFWINTFAIDEHGEEKLIRRWLLKNKRDYFISDIKAFCSDKKGEIISMTVTAGTFETCKTTYIDLINEQHSWYAAQVPFGLIKSVVLKGSGYDHELLSYSN